MENKQIIGTCSICGGDVTMPIIWYSIYPPRPTCNKCGAVAADERKPIIPMIEREEKVQRESTNIWTTR